MSRLDQSNVLPMCDHMHTQEHINYLTAEGHTEFEDSIQGTYAYTLKHRVLVCVHCLFVVHTVIKRVVFLVMPKSGTRVISTYNLKSDAEDYAKYVDGRWIEATVEGSM